MGSSHASVIGCNPEDQDHLTVDWRAGSFCAHATVLENHRAVGTLRNLRSRLLSFSPATQFAVLKHNILIPPHLSRPPRNLVFKNLTSSSRMTKMGSSNRPGPVHLARGPTLEFAKRPSITLKNEYRAYQNLAMELIFLCRYFVQAHEQSLNASARLRK